MKLRQAARPQRLSAIVHKFLSRWLILSLAGLVLVVSVWGFYQFHSIRKIQEHNVQAVADHVDTYLSQFRENLEYAASFFKGHTSDLSELRTFLRENSSFEKVYVLSGSGQTLQSVPRTAKPPDFSRLIRSSENLGGTSLTSPYYSANKKSLVVSMLKSLSGNRMLLAELDLANIRESVSGLTQHMLSAVAILTDKKGNFIVHPEIAEIDQQVSKEDLEVVSVSNKGQVQSGFYRLQRGFRLMSSTQTSWGQWKILVGQKAITLFQPILYVMFLSLLGMVLMFSLLAFFFQRRLNKNVITPLSHFLMDVEAMKKGINSPLTIQNRQTDPEKFLELQELQNEFEQMQRVIRQRQVDLQENERKLNTLMNNLPGMAFRCYNSPEWSMDFVSRGCFHLLGYSAEELLSGDAVQYSDFVHPDDAERVWTEVQEGIRNDRTYQLEYRILTREGTEKWVWEQGQIVDWTSSGESILEGFIVDITERKQTRERLNYLSFHDALTGLYNRNFFEEEMRRLQKQHSTRIGIIICDLNGLKLINDTLGHESGDSVLVSAASLIQNSFRSSDIVARIGGDEFAVLLTGVDQKTVQDLVLRIREAVRRYNAHDPKIHLTLSIGYAVSNGEPQEPQALFREADNRMYREKIQEGQSAHSSIVQALMKALEARDFITEGHSDRLQDLTLALAQRADLPYETPNDLKLLARFHDLGKVGIPDRILFKRGPLDDEEAREMRKHPEIGHRIAHSVPQLAHLADWILKHHEHWDGRGYPLGLQGRDIPLPCRILAIADAYDAMTSDRPYRSALSHEEAITELQRKAGIQFDPELVDKFVSVHAAETEVFKEESP